MRFNIATLIILIFFLGFFIIEKQEVDVVSSVEFLPPDLTAYCNFKNGVESLEQFHQSRFGKTIDEIDFVEVAEYLNLDPIFISRLKKAGDTLQKVERNALFQKLFSSNCSVALFPKRNWSSSKFPFENYLITHTILISRQHSLRTVIATAKSVFPEIIERESVSYGQYRIRRFGLGDKTIAAIFVDGYVLLSFEERLLREALYIRDQAEMNLASNSSFSTIHQRIKSSDREFYLDLAALRELSETLAENVQSPHEKALFTELSNLKGFPTAGYGSWRKDRVLRDSLMIQMDYQNILPLTGKMLANKPEPNETFPFVVEDVLFYYWSNTLNARLLWKMYVEERKLDGQDISGIKDGVLQITGYSIEDVTKMLGSDIGFILRPSEHDQFIPIPDTAILVKLRDRKRIKKVVDNTTAHFDISLQSRRYKSVKYFYWGLYPMENLQPVLAIHKGYLIVANTLNIFKSIVDLMADKDPLASSIDFASIDPGFQEKNNSVCYIDQKTFMVQLRELVSWAGTMLAIQDRQAAAKSKILIDRLINPLLLGLTMYEKAATRTYIDENWIITESRTRTENPSDDN